MQPGDIVYIKGEESPIGYKIERLYKNLSGKWMVFGRSLHRLSKINRPVEDLMLADKIVTRREEKNARRQQNKQNQSDRKAALRSARSQGSS